MENVETAFRDWILYSCSINALYCFYCLLFDGCKKLFEEQSNGVTNQKNLKKKKKVNDHEK